MRIVRRLLLTLIVLALLAVAVGTVLYQGTQDVPEFYQQALRQPMTVQQQEEAGHEFERQLAETHNEVRNDGDWEAIFTDQQINAWLTVDLPEQFPDAVAPPFSDPRLKFSSDRVDIGCYYRDQWLDSVISIAAEVYLTQRSNEIAVRILGVRAGWVPVPLNRFLEKVSEAARRGGLELSWAQEAGKPVALIRLPKTYELDGEREVELKSIQIREGDVRIVGSSEG